MTSRYPMADADDSDTYPERAPDDRDEPADTRHLSPDAEDDEEEAGYGYGV
jgi:hypothetical protein